MAQPGFNSDPIEVFLAGQKLLRSTNGAPFKKVDVGLKARSMPRIDATVAAVAGRSPDDYYAGTASGVARFADKKFWPTQYTEDVAAMTFAGEDLYVAHNAK